MTPTPSIQHAAERFESDPAQLVPHLIDENATLHDALLALDALSGGSLTLFVVDDEGRLSATLTDGDVRRALLHGASLQDSIAMAGHYDFLAIRHGDDPFIAFQMAKKRAIRLLPVLRDGYIRRLYDLKTQKTVLPIDAVLMAGGRGERLRPLTLDTPKPLLPVGGKPIIDYNVDELIANGVSSIFISVNYLKEQIISHFDGYSSQARILCVAEPKRMGTIGSLSLIVPELTHDNLLLMNSDLLTTLDFEAFYRHHVESGADLTIAGVPYTVSVPYAVMHTQEDRVTALDEKPTFNYLANGGVYIMRRELAQTIPADTYVDAPDFIEDLIAAGRKVSFFAIDGTWIDIGSPNDYEYADRLMAAKRLLRIEKRE